MLKIGGRQIYVELFLYKPWFGRNICNQYLQYVNLVSQEISHMSILLEGFVKLLEMFVTEITNAFKTALYTKVYNFDPPYLGAAICAILKLSHGDNSSTFKFVVELITKFCIL